MKNEFENTKKIESKQLITELTSFSEMKKPVETLAFTEDYANKNDTNLLEKDKKSTKSSNHGFMKMSTYVLGTFAAVSVILPNAVDQDHVTIAFDNAIVTDTSVQYNVSIDNPDNVELSILLQNDFTKREETLIGTYASNTIEGLKPGVKYQLIVQRSSSFGKKRLAEMDVQTLSENDYRESKFSGVKTECKCHIDGFFHFTMDYTDNIQCFSNFQATLKDKFGNESKCSFNDDLHSEQKILVRNSSFQLKGNAAELIIIYNYKDASGNVVVREYRSEVSI